jgi:hypothetical protein
VVLDVTIDECPSLATNLIDWLAVTLTRAKNPSQ